MFQSTQIAIARQRDCRTLNILDAMDDIMSTVNPCQHHMTNLQVFRFL